MFDLSYKVVGKIDAYFTIFDSALAESLGFTDTLEAGLTENSAHFFKADTLEELAAAAGFDEATFLATIEEYNGYCETGVDEQFGKNAEYLNAISEGPFYAVKHDLMSLDITGGIRTSDQFEVIDENGTPIPNLYAVGSTSVAEIGGTAGGANFASAAYSSLTAAESIIALLQ